jgi:predicted Abi (CAAX) family protease
MGMARLPKRWWVILTALLIFALGLSGCGASKISKENFDKIQTGMSQGEVQAILGEPTESSSVDVALFSGTTSTWKEGDTAITIQFVNGMVVAKQFSRPAK